MGVVDFCVDLYFELILLVCNIFVCGVGYFLLCKCNIVIGDFLSYLWVMFLFGLLLVLDFNNILLMLGFEEVSLWYVGGLFLSVVNYLVGMDVFVILFYLVVYVFCGENKISVILLDIL